MNWWQTVITILVAMLGSNVITKILENRAAKKAAKTARDNELEDRAMVKDDKTKTLEERFKEFTETQSKENREIRQRLSGVENTLGLINDDLSWERYNALRKEALGYIRRGKVKVEDRADLQERYARYKRLSKRDDLDHIMKQLDQLQPIYDEEE